MINPLVLKAFLSGILEAQTFLFPYLKSSMTIDEALITSGSILLSYEGSIYSYSPNNINLPSKVVAKSQFKVSVVYQSLIQDDQSLIVFNDVVLLINGTNMDEVKMKPFRIIKDELKQYKDKYGVFEHSIFFETEYSFTQIV